MAVEEGADDFVEDASDDEDNDDVEEDRSGDEDEEDRAETSWKTKYM